MLNVMDLLTSSMETPVKKAKSPQYLVGVMSVREHLQSVGNLFISSGDDYRQGQRDALAVAQEAVCGLYHEGNVEEPARDLGYEHE